MKIGIVGSGYVGLVTGTCLADFGCNILCMDSDKKKIAMLKEGKVPIYEPGLDDLMERNIYYKRLFFSDDIKETVESCDVIFIAVGTPSMEDGSADLKYVISVAEDIGRYINSYKVIVDKSTVPVGTGRMVKKTIREQIEKRGEDIEFDVVSNPEFLREGKAIHDFTHPDRVVIGSESEKAANIMREVYRVLYINQTPFTFTNIETAEMIKYASNAFLAVKISFINEMSLVSEKVGADVQEIARTMGMDGRISPKFLHAGPGYGGSCFPKDTRAIVDTAIKNGEEFMVVSAAVKANEKQKMKMVRKISAQMETLENKTIAILGLTFKPDTDDMRESPALVIIPELIKKGAKIRAFCPQGSKESKWRLKDFENSITYCKDEYHASENADALVILTEWNQFRGMNLEKIREKMKGKDFFDLRNIYSRDGNIRDIFNYQGVGLGISN